MIETILTPKANIRLLRFLYIFPNRDFSFHEIKEKTGIGGKSLETGLKKLIYQGIIIERKRRGKTYKINIRNPNTQVISTLFDNEKKAFTTIEPKKISILANLEKKIIEKISGLINIILFGSVAKGTDWERSDTDILILVREKHNENKLITVELEEKFKNIKLQIHLMTIDEFRNQLAQGQPLINEIDKTGISLSGKPLIILKKDTNQIRF